MSRSSGEIFERALSDAGLSGVRLVHSERTGSTNDDARRLLDAGGLVGPALVIADEQSAGRGRAGRTWLSPRGSLAMTMVLPDVPLEVLPVLPLAAGVAVADALAARDAPPALLKWPNDVTIGGRKVGGILCESVVGQAGARALVGVGINVAPPPTGARLDAATWVHATRPGETRERLAARVTRGVLERLRGFRGASIVAEWKERALPWWGRRVRLVDHSGEGGARAVEATLEDVDGQGRLVIRDASGERRALTSAEITELRDAGGDPDVRYFRDVEAAFIARRGDPLFISNADWVRIRRWRERGIPLRILLRGIEDAFDSHAHSFSRRQKVRSLSYCEPAIDAAILRWRRALTDGLPGRRELDGAIDRLATRLRESPTQGAAAAADEVAGLAGARGSEAATELETRLRAIEDGLVRSLEERAGTARAAEIRNAAREATSAYETRMPERAYERLLVECFRRRLLEEFGLPRLTLADGS